MYAAGIRSERLRHDCPPSQRTCPTRLCEVDGTRYIVHVWRFGDQPTTLCGRRATITRRRGIWQIVYARMVWMPNAGMPTWRTPRMPNRLMVNVMIKSVRHSGRSTLLPYRMEPDHIHVVDLILSQLKLLITRRHSAESIPPPRAMSLPAGRRSWFL